MIVHLVEPFGTSRTVAWSWNRLDWQRCEFVGSGEKPLIRDMVEMCVRSRSLGLGDVVVLTNADSFLCVDTVDRVREAGGCCFSHRINVPRLERRGVMSAELRSREKYVGVDLVAFPVNWWLSRGRQLPDLYLGCEAWDWIFRAEILEAGGREIGPVVMHQNHQPSWMRSRYKGVNLQNRQAAYRWAVEFGWDRVVSLYPSFVQYCVESGAR